jgi:TRAP-type C4-dicarboxylate transport system substrate-binding protein
LFNLINEELARKNLYMLSLGGGILEPEYIWSTKGKEIDSLSEVDGVKMRIASYQATLVLESYGVAANRLTSAETYLGLQRGVVSAAVANIATVMGRSLYEQLAMCYKMPVTAYTVAPFMLRDRWDSLSDDVRAPLKTAAKWYDDNLVANSDKVYKGYWKTVQQHGVKVVNPSKKDVQSFTDHSKSGWDEWKKSVGEEIGSKAIALARGKA